VGVEARRDSAIAVEGFGVDAGILPDGKFLGVAVEQLQGLLFKPNTAIEFGTGGQGLTDKNGSVVGLPKTRYAIASIVSSPRSSAGKVKIMSMSRLASCPH